MASVGGSGQISSIATMVLPLSFVFSTSELTTQTATSSTTIAAPALTASGTTAECYKWYTVQSSDSCYTVEQEQGITFVQLQRWNPKIDST